MKKNTTSNLSPFNLFLDDPNKTASQPDVCLISNFTVLLVKILFVFDTLLKIHTTKFEWKCLMHQQC